MGTDKAHLQLGRQDFVERIAKSLSEVATHISIVSSKPDARLWGLPVVQDIHQNCGALGGIHAALDSTREAWALIVSCDMPFVTSELFHVLAAHRVQRNLCGELFQAVAPVQTDGRPQPLCALYAREPGLQRATQLLAAGELRPRALLGQVRTRWVAPHEINHLRGASLFFMNINTPQDYVQARAEFAKQDPPAT